MRPSAFSDILFELHTKRYTKVYIKREHELAHFRRQPGATIQTPGHDPGMYSPFGNQNGYGGLVPTGEHMSCL